MGYPVEAGPLWMVGFIGNEIGSWTAEQRAFRTLAYIDTTAVTS